MTPAITGRIKLLRQFSAAVFDQVALSGTSFAVGFILIRFTTDKDYGMYVLVQSALVLLVSAQNAWLMGPLSVVSARGAPEARQEMVSTIRFSQRRFLRRVAPPLLVVPLLAYLLGFLGAVPAIVAGTAIFAAWAALRREYLRGVLMLYSRPNSVLHADGFYCTFLLLGVVLVTIQARAVVISATIVLTGAAIVGTVVMHRSLARNPGWVQHSDPAPIWRAMRQLGVWSSAGAILYWLFSQSYNYVLASRLDLKAVADVNATRLTLMPAIVLTIGMQGLLMPTAAKWYAQLGARALLRRLLLFIAAVGVLDVIYFGFVWIFRGWLIGTMFHKHIEDRDRLLLLWAAVAFIGLIRDVLQCAVFASGRLRSMAWQTGLSAAVALLLTWFGIPFWGAAAPLVGQIVGELVNLVGIIMLVRQDLARQA